MSIKVKHVFYSYLASTPHPVEALNDINLNIGEHDFVALVGETGSGKSTLAQHFNALLIPKEGEVEIDNYLVTNRKRKNKNVHQLRKHVGMVFQFPEYQLFEESIEKDVAFGLLNYGYKKDEAIKIAHQTLAKVGLDESFYLRSPLELSGGERRKVAFAGILALNPDIVVLDEPTVGLDPKASQDIMNIVKSLYDSGKTIILITHDMDLLVRYVNKVFYLDKGHIVYEGTPYGLFKQNNIGLKMPPLYELVSKLNDKGFSIPIELIHQLSDIWEYIK